ncbi:MAG TPA: 16S rRNA (adenine(1518)-N(6)/adenine(1519)-N(6))-dimethyltransferase RsmA [Candidatus Gallacutalibacter stercoravium]|nr:16S rRNA (adenine(1518)-N(6)/adenine(1519)-N(6))-dimethyltransferase RsmA [Candidatus Gallacutalibacter stercoravium]
MGALSDIRTIQEILSRHHFTFSKAMGQNFLINPSVCPRMAQMGGAAPDAGVLEIGPGIGVLTCELAQRAGKVVAVELDKRLLPVLEETLHDYSNVTVINQDVMKADLAGIIKKEFGKMDVYVCANLPYYITSPVIMRLLEERLPIKAITVMVQKEAAERLCAQPGTRQAGAVTLAVRYYAEPVRLFQVSRGSFYPAPHVDSAVIQLNIRQTPAVAVRQEKLFFQAVHAAFAQRRKTLLNALSSGLGLAKEQAGGILSRANVSAGLRAEQLTLEQFAAIADAMDEFWEK